MGFDRSALVAMGLGVSMCAGSALAVTHRQVEAAAARPNVVVLYVDDVKQNTPWLWNDRSRTPQLARFASHGVVFTNAVGSTPLCGPSRATLLTGQYSHGHGTIGNYMGGFDPRSTLATELKEAGYHTLLVGKYLNGISEAAPTRESVDRFAAGWDRFDIIWKWPSKGKGLFYRYYLWTKSKVSWKGSKPKDHSTHVIGSRLASHIRNAPDDKPLFAVASVSSGHVPNTPLAWHDGSRKCRGSKPYAPPSFNERDVSDKPGYIRSLPRLRLSSASMVSRCEEFLGVDAALAKIRNALRDTGRLDDTLLIFTSDNGYMLGDHRYPGRGGKYWPHAAPLPLYMLWPAALGDKRRIVREPVSNVDIPVTICALAGCSLDGADGVDLLPLMNGDRPRLGRKFVYLEMLRSQTNMPLWCGLVTTRAYDGSTTWQYTRYENGQRELYDLTHDRHRLKDLARKAWHRERIDGFDDRLRTAGCPVMPSG